MNRAQRRAQRTPRRSRTIAGLSFLAVASTFTAYTQVLRAPRAYAATICSVNDPGDTAGDSTNRTLRYCFDQVNSASADTIDVSNVSDIQLKSAMPDLVSSVTISGPSAPTAPTKIHPAATYSGFGFFKINAASTTIELNGLDLYDFTGVPFGEGVISSTKSSTALTISHSTVHDNAANAGSIHFSGSASPVTISYSTFDHNDGGNYDGGALYVKQGAISVSDSEFTYNSANGGRGGAIYKGLGSYDDITITGSTFAHNYAESSYGGGAIFGYYVDDLKVEDSTFSSNSAYGMGGAITLEKSYTVTVSGSRFDGNSVVSGSGGAMYLNNAYTSASISNSTFVGNSAEQGGAVYWDERSTTLVVSNSYFGGNTGTNFGSALQGNNMELNFTTLVGTATGGTSLINTSTGRTLTFNASVLDAPSGVACRLNYPSQPPATVVDDHAVSTDTSCGFTGTGSVESATDANLALDPSASSTVNGVSQTYRKPGSSSILVTGAPSTGPATDQIGGARSGSFTIGSIQSAGSTPSTFTVTPASSAPSGGTVTATDTNTDGTWDLVATPASGYKFTSWSCTASQTPVSTTSATTTITPTADTTCTATFTRVSVTAAKTPSSGGTVSATDGNTDGIWNLVATPAPGYVFTSWGCTASQTPNSTSSATTTVTPTADTTCTATFTLATVTPSSSQQAGGSVTATDTNNDGTWDLVATPAPGYVFAGWTCTASQTPVSPSSATTTITPTANTTCTATFNLIPVNTTSLLTGEKATGNSVFVTGTATPLTQATYRVESSKSKIRDVNPAHFYFWTKVTANRSATVVTETSSANGYLIPIERGGSKVYYAGTQREVKGATFTWSGGVLTVSNLPSGSQEYWVRVKFDAHEVTGSAATIPSTVTFGFTAPGGSTQNLAFIKR